MFKSQYYYCKAIGQVFGTTIWLVCKGSKALPANDRKCFYL